MSRFPNPINISVETQTPEKNGFVYDAETLNMVYPMEKKQTYPWTQKVPSSNLPGIQKK